MNRSRHRVENVRCHLTNAKWSTFELHMLATLIHEVNEALADVVYLLSPPPTPLPPPGRKRKR